MGEFVEHKCPHGIDTIYRCTDCEPVAGMFDRRVAPRAETVDHPKRASATLSALRDASNSLVAIARVVANDRDAAFTLLDDVATTLEQTNMNRLLANRIRTFLADRPR